eukprot:NODE_7_length_67686_cov_1.621421.p3 type:complete len:859 gc:universal NODE_7_length_67686_cov_1.621421:43279-40703(-)
MSNNKIRKTIMLKFRSGNFVDEFTCIEEHKQRQFGECVNFALQQTRRYTHLYLGEDHQVMTPFLDNHSEKSKNTGNKVYILPNLEAKDILKTLGRKRKEVKRFKDQDRNANKREIGKLQREMLDLERQLFQHFLGILHCLCEEYFVKSLEKSEEIVELRVTTEDLQRKIDLYELDPNNIIKADSKLENESVGRSSPVPKNEDSGILKTKVKDLKLEIEELYDELSIKERTMNRLNNLFQQIGILLPSVPDDLFVKKTLTQNSSLIDDAASISIGDFDLEDFTVLLLTFTDYVYHIWDQNEKSVPPSPPLRARRRSSSESSAEPTKNAIDKFFMPSSKKKDLEEENLDLKHKIADLEDKLNSKSDNNSDLIDSYQNSVKDPGLFDLQDQLDSLKTENSYLEKQMKDIQKEKQEWLENSEKENGSLESKIQELENEKIELMADSERRIRAMQQKTEEIMEKRIDELSNDLRDKDDVINQLTEQLNELEEKQSEFDRNLEKIKAQNQEEIDELSAQHQDSFKAFKDVAQSQDDNLNEVRQQLTDYRIRAFGYRILLNHSRSKFNSLIENFNICKKEKMEVDEALKKCQIEIESLSNTNKGLAEELELNLNATGDLKNSFKERDLKMTSLEKDYNDTKQKLADIQNQQNEFIKAKSDAQDRLFEVQNQMSAMKSKYDLILEEKNTLTSDKEELLQNVELLQKDINNLSAGNEIGQQAMEESRNLKLKIEKFEKTLIESEKREQRMNADLDGVMIEFERVNGLLMTAEVEKERLNDELSKSIKEGASHKLNYDNMRMNMIADGTDNQVLRSMIDGLKESYFEELNNKFKAQKELERSIKEMQVKMKEHLYNSSGKSTQTLISD